MKSLPRYRTIETPTKLYETNTRPILISISDAALNSYVVKHNNGLLPCSKLANELIAHYFLRFWHLKTPIAAIIEVNSKHISELTSATRQPRFF